MKEIGATDTYLVVISTKMGIKPFVGVEGIA